MRRRRRTLRLATLAALACVLLVAPAPSAAARPCAGAHAHPGDASRADLAKATVCLLNKQRTRHDLHRLRLNPRLSKAARAHTLDMVRKRYFDHVSRTGRDVVDRLTSTGYIGGSASWVVGENLAWGSGDRSTPREIVRSWMHSPGHRRNILTRRFREIGIGVVFNTPTGSGPLGATYTTTFGARG